jgi:hypothetical protein
MRVFNRYNKEDNFRWMGFRLCKITFGFGFSFGKPTWWIPKISIIINDDKLLKLKFGWLLFCCGIQILHDTQVLGQIKYVYRGKGKPLPYTRDIYE